MSIFGALDAATISTNPFFVEAGTYSAEVTDAKFSTGRDGQRQLRIVYTITDEDSEYYDRPATQFFNLIDPDMTNEQFALLPADERSKIKRTLASLKRTLCGNDDNDEQPGLGIDFDDLNDENWQPEVLKGIKVNLAISNYGTNGVNVKWVNRTF